VGGIPATNVKVVDAATITAETGAHSEGAADLAVINPDGLVGSLVTGFTYAPAASGNSPSNSSAVSSSGQELPSFHGVGCQSAAGNFDPALLVLALSLLAGATKRSSKRN
jgi:hypothetical protein